MESTLLKEILSGLPTNANLCIIIGILVLVIIYHKYLKPLKKSLSYLGNDFKNLESDFKDLKKDVKRIETNVITITALLSDKLKINPSLFQSNSPITLTGLGKEILEKSSGKKIIDDNLEMFIKSIEKEHPNTALDVDIKAHEILLNSFNSEEIFNNVKTFIFNNPVYSDTEINILKVVRIMAIYLRDKYLNIYPELNISEENIS